MPSDTTKPAANLDAINAETVGFLLSAEGRAAAVQLVAVDDDHLLTELAHLRHRFTPEQAGALVALARLRHRATTKFPAADRLFFTNTALEQAPHIQSPLTMPPISINTRPKVRYRTQFWI